MIILRDKSTLLIDFPYLYCMILQTERLLIKEVSLNHAPFYFELFSDPDFIKNINDKNLKSVEETEVFLENTMIPNLCKNGLGFFTVFEKLTHTPIGVASLLKRDQLDALDVGYAFLPKGRGKGYATEATRAVMDYAHTSLQQSKIIAFTMPKNEASKKVLRNLGFTYVGVKRVYENTEDCLFEYEF